MVLWVLARCAEREREHARAHAVYKCERDCVTVCAVVLWVLARCAEREHTHARTHAHTHTRTHTRVQVCERLCDSVCMYMYTRTHVCAYTHIHMCDTHGLATSLMSACAHR